MSRNEEKGKLFVGGLSWDTTQASLQQYFSRYGEVLDCVVVMNPTTGKSRGFGFVNFKDPSCVETVLAAGPHVLDGKQIDPNGCNRKKLGKAGGKEVSRKKLFVGGLPPSVDEQQLREGFSRYGKVNDVVIVYDQQKQKPRGFGFLTFEDEDSVQRIVQERFVQIAGKQVECKHAEPKDSSSSSQLMGDVAAAAAGGAMILAQAADGSVGLVPASALHASAALRHGGMAVGPAAAATGGVGLLSSADLSAAAAASYASYRAHDLMQPSLLSAAGVRYMTPSAGATPQYVLLGGGVNGSSVSAATAVQGGAGLMMLNSGAAAAAMNPAAAASGLLMPNGPAAGSAGMVMQRPVMLPSAGSPAAGYYLTSGAGVAAPALMPQYVVGYPQPTGVSSELAAASPYAASPYGISVPQAAAFYPAAVGKADTAAAGLMAQQSADISGEKVAAQPTPLAAAYNIVSGGEGGEHDGVSVSDCQSAAAAAAAAAAAVGSGGRLAQAAVSPALGYYLLPNYQSPYSAVATDPYLAAAAGSTGGGRINAAVVSAAAHGYHPYRR